MFCCVNTTLTVFNRKIIYSVTFYEPPHMGHFTLHLLIQFGCGIAWTDSQLDCQQQITMLRHLITVLERLSIYLDQHFLFYFKRFGTLFLFIFFVLFYILSIQYLLLIRLEQQRTQREVIRCKTGVGLGRQSRKTRTRLAALRAIEAQRVTLTPLEYLERVATHFAF